jgi:hypothetical protein
MGRFDDSTSDQVGEYYQAQNWRKEGADEENQRVVDILKKERREWGMGTMAARILDNLIIQIERNNK